MKIIELLIQKGFHHYGEDCYTKTLSGRELYQYFKGDANNLEKVKKGEIDEIILFIYPRKEIAEWKIKCNYLCVQDNFKRVMEYIKQS